MSRSQTSREWKTFRNALDTEHFILAASLLEASPGLINERNGLGETVFHHLAVENRLPSVEWLVDHGAEINVSNNFQPMIFEVAQLGYGELLSWLLRRGADPLLKNTEGQGLGAYLMSMNCHKQAAKILALFSELGLREPSEAEFIRDCCLGSIRINAHNEAGWEMTLLGTIHDHLAPHVHILPHELPIISFNSFATDWALYTTRRMILSTDGKRTEFPRENFSQLDFENLEEDYDSPRSVESLVCLNGTSTKFYYESGIAAAAPIGYFKFWKLWS
jgi:hypothetical protein